MKKLYRHMLLFSATVVFLAMAPLVVLYAMGYRLPSSIDPVPVGVVFLETKPRKMNIELDGQAVGDTPRSLSNLRPGLIHVRLWQDGFNSWEKNLPIEPGVVTEARDIWLFPNPLKQESVQPNVKLFALSPHRQFIALVDIKNQLHVIDEEGQAVMPAMPLRRLPDALVWSPDNSSILLRSAQQRPQIVTLAQTISQPTNVLVSAVKDIKWDPRIPGRLLVLTTPGQLLAYSVINKTAVVIASQATTFATSNRQIFIQQGDQTLTVRDLQGTIGTTFTALPTKPFVTLRVTPGGAIAALTEDKELFILDEKQTFTSIAKGVTKADWSPDGQLLLVQNEPNALHVYALVTDHLVWLEPNQLDIIIRLSREITNPQWFAGGRHLIYQVADEIVITEIDTRDHPVSQVIDSTNTGNAQAMVGQDGETLFYLKNDQSVPTLMVAQLY